MEFLNPLALAALAAAVIPLIIHLFNFRRPRKVDFSSLAFVKELQKSTMRRVRIKQWLLLVLRILAIACLVLAFARPTLTGNVAGAVGGRAASSVAIVIDNSPSMSLRDAEGEYLRQAKDIAAGIIDALADGDELFLVPTSGVGATWDRFSTTGAAMEAVERIEVRPGGRTVPEATAEAGRALESAAHINREIYVISDLQESAMPDSTASDGGGGTSTYRTYLLPIGDRIHANVAVTDVQVESRILEMGQPMRLSATLVNYGTDPIEGDVASVFLEGQRLAQTTVDLEPRVPTTAHFTASPQQRGWLSGIVQIGDDGFVFDNERYFTAHVPDRRSVLVVRGDGQDAGYLQLAFSPDLGRDRVAFDVEAIPETGLPAADLSRFDVVVLVGPRSLSTGEVASLERYVSAGGGLFITPPNEPVPSEYDDLLGVLGGGSLSGFSGSVESNRSIAAFERVELEHNLFEGMFRDRPTDSERAVESPDIYRAVNYAPGPGNEQSLISLSNGYPFLQEIRHGRGVAFLMAVAPNRMWSDLPVRGLFIPLMYRTMYYLSASESVAGEQLTAASPAELRVPRVSDAAQLRIVSPDGTEYVPEQRDLFGASLLTIDGAVIEQPGIYDVRAGEDVVRRVPVNVDEAESDLSTLEDEEGRARLASSLGWDVDLIPAGGRAPGDVVASVAQQRMGVELWNLFLLLALAFLIAETVVAKRWRPEGVPA
ncbi:MAG: BatA domain-containing protein [Rhodothermales bacterium]